MKHVYTWFCALALGSAIAGRPQGDSPWQAEDLGSEFWRETRNCGPNALYLLLRSHGVDASYEEILSKSDVGPTGTSLGKLKLVATSIGVETLVSKANLEALESLELPVIAHMDYFTGDMTQLGHFVLLTDVDRASKSISAFDGTTAIFIQVPIAQFLKSWSGNVLHLDSSGSLKGFDIPVLFLVSAVTAFTIAVLARSR